MSDEKTMNIPAPAPGTPKDHPLIGKMIGGCKIEKKLGQGGMGAVFLATQVSLNRPVAVKVIAEAFISNEKYTTRFEREARAVAMLNHPNVVQVFDMGKTEDGLYFIVMELIEGKSLGDIMKVRKVCPEREALQIIRKAALGLQAAAEKKIIHRDIKPDNLMITNQGEVKVADFGLAKNTEATAQLTESGHVMGTPAYIAPEQGEGLPADHRSDIYSLGATFFAIVTGSLPYVGETPISIVMQHIRAEVPDPKARNAELTDHTCAIIKKTMAKDPTARYQSGNQLAHDIAIALASGPFEELYAVKGCPPIEPGDLTGGGVSVEDMMADEQGGITPLGSGGGTALEVNAAITRTAHTTGLQIKKRQKTALVLGIGGIAVVGAGVAALVVFAGGNPGGPSTGSGGPTSVSSGAGVSTTAGPTPPTTVATGPVTPTKPPPIRLGLTQPAGGSTTKNDNVRVGGTLTNPKSAQRIEVRVKNAKGDVNEQPKLPDINASTGDYTEVVALSEGTNTIEVVASGADVETETKTVTITRDSVRPKITLDGVSGGTVVTKDREFVLAGTIEDAGGVKEFTVQDQLVAVDAKGRFSRALSLKEGTNAIGLQAEDKAGNTGNQLLTIEVDSTAPQITLTSATGEVVGSKPEYRLEGNVDERGAKLTVGDAAVAVEPSGKFGHAVTLADGENTFTLTATDKAGNVSTREVKIQFRRLPEGLRPGRDANEVLSAADGSVLVLVPAGQFSMGFAEADSADEKPVHTVETKAFYIGRYEVSAGQYRKFLDWTSQQSNPHRHCHKDEPRNKDHTPKAVAPEGGRGRGGADARWNQADPDNPAVGVDWWDAHSYCAWAGLRLPTEAEWEKAATWDAAKQAKRRWPWGDDAPSGDKANFGGERKFPLRVNSYPAGVSPVGAHNMAGNVLEWTADGYQADFYGTPAAARLDPLCEPSPDMKRVLRGGHFAGSADHIRGTKRLAFDAKGRQLTVGFRVARAAE